MSKLPQGIYNYLEVDTKHKICFSYYISMSFPIKLSTNSHILGTLLILQFYRILAYVEKILGLENKM